MIVRGRAWVFGDDVSTDVIIPGKYLKLTEREAAAHVMEGLDPAFAAAVRPSDVVVAGRNFGAGSSREYAASALRIAGVSCLISPLFARIFYRNAINCGLPAIECADAGRIGQGDQLEIDVVAGVVRDLTNGETLRGVGLSAHILTLIEAGGLVEYLKQRVAAGRVVSR